jgi:hypothetical protein
VSLREARFAAGASAALTFILPGGKRFDSREWVLELVEDGRPTVRATFQTGNSVPAVRPEDLLALAPGQPPWAALALRADGPPSAVPVTGHFNTPAVPGATARLRLARVERATAELPFAFKDVPLP